MLDGIYQDDDGDYVLVDKPSAPENFFNLTKPSDDSPGLYLIGQSQFFVKPFTIAPIFHRQFGRGDDILVGIFTVLLIAVLADIVQTVLLHTLRGRTANIANRLVFAAFVDEVSHLRNICNYFKWQSRSGHRENDNDVHRDNNERQGRSSRRLHVAASALAILIALLLFVVEVLAVVLTQPQEVNSSHDQYNVRAFQPAGTTRGMTKFVRRTMGLRGCVSPIMTPRDGPRRNFLIHSCTDFDDGGAEERFSDEDIVREISVKSFYHKGGCDHFIEYGSETYNVSVRSELFLATDGDGAWRIMYENRDDEELSHALYLQMRFIYAAIEYSCNSDFSQQGCAEAAEQLETVESKKVEESIRLWRGSEDDVFVNATGLLTRFRTQINSPFNATNNAVRELAVSGIIEEVGVETEYESVSEDKLVSGLPGLLTEQGRVAGVVLVVVLLACGLAVLIVLRYLLKPVSLAALAAGVMEEDKWERVEQQISWVCPSKEDDIEDGGTAELSRGSSRGGN